MVIRLCVSEIDHDASIALFDDEKLLYALGEERLSRIKMHQGFPKLSIEYALRHAGMKLTDVDELCIAKPPMEIETKAIFDKLNDYPWKPNGAPLHAMVLDFFALRFYKKHTSTSTIRDMNRQIDRWIEDTRFPTLKVKRNYNHHFLHAASAYYSSGFENALAITADGQGAGVTASVYKCERGKFTKLHEVPWPNSMGVFYGAVTKALGFKPNRHEGKITGLASYEPPAEECLAFCRSMAHSSGKTFNVHAIYGRYPELLRLTKKYTMGQVAAAFQIVLEEVLTDFVKHYVNETGSKNVALAGGVFANVKLNQRIKDIPGVEEIFVFPAMADCGLCWGIGAYEAAHHKPFEPRPIKNVYWGCSYTEQDMERALRAGNVPYERVEDVPSVVGDHLAKGEIVWRYDGAMEFGPRALGNRSIMYHSRDKTVNDWLNKILNRTEFMPFAPVTLAEEAHRCYENLDAGRRTAYYMTMTFDCTPAMREWSPAAVHVDGTARPQLIDEAMNPMYYRIIKKYYERTGIPSVINTSYNMHEEPIVCSPDDAIRAYVPGKIGVLSMGPFVSRMYTTPLSKGSAADAPR